MNLEQIKKGVYMKLKKAKVLTLGVVLSTSLTVGFNVNNKFNKLENQLATLSKEVNKKNNVIEELKDNNKTLQDQLTEVSGNVQTVQQDVEEIKN